MAWTTESSAHPRRARWDREECLFERRKPLKWTHAKRTHASAGRSSSAWHQVNPKTAFPKSPTRRQDDAASSFEQLADQWEAETAFESVLTRKAMHPAYQRIIGMGEPGVPMLLDRLRREPAQWFWALTAMTGEDPARGEDTLEGARAAWLSWGVERGLLRD